MSEETSVYDLGEVADPSATRAVPATSRARSTTAPQAVQKPTLAEPDPFADEEGYVPVRLERDPARAAAANKRRQGGFRPGPALAGSLSLWLPGAGQGASGNPKLGLLFACLLALFASGAWAVSSRFSSLSETATLLGGPAELPAWILVILFACGAGTHISAVLNAHDLGEANRGRGESRPLVSLLASFVVPGWGQVLNGDRVRAVLFLGGLWHIAGAWLVLYPTLRHVMASPMVSTQPFLLGPVLLTCATCVLWALAAYDATASAVSRRGASC